MINTLLDAYVLENDLLRNRLSLNDTLIPETQGPYTLQKNKEIVRKCLIRIN